MACALHELILNSPPPPPPPFLYFVSSGFSFITLSPIQNQKFLLFLFPSSSLNAFFPLEIFLYSVYFHEEN